MCRPAVHRSSGPEKFCESPGEITPMLEMRERAVARECGSPKRAFGRSDAGNREGIPPEEGDFHWRVGKLVILACARKSVNVQWAYAIGPVRRHKHQ